MKRLIYLFLLFGLFSCNNKPLELNVMTFNIRLDNPGDSLNSWPYRKDVAAAVVRENNIDLLGTQEVLVNQLNDLKERLPEYNAVGVGRADGMEKGEYSALFYKAEKFSEIESGTFWLSETPDLAGSKGWDGACERVATWAILKEKTTGKQLFFINTHLDHIGKMAREKGVKLLMERAKLYSKGLPIIITGDFNSNPDSDVIGFLTESGEFRDSKLIAQSISGNAGTFHDFGRIPVENRDRIDFIFVTKQMEVLSYKVLPDSVDGIYISDHAPVWVKITI